MASFWRNILSKKYIRHPVVAVLPVLGSVCGCSAKNKEDASREKDNETPPPRQYFSARNEQGRFASKQKTKNNMVALRDGRKIWETKRKLNFEDEHNDLTTGAKPTKRQTRSFAVSFMALFLYYYLRYLIKCLA